MLSGVMTWLEGSSVVHNLREVGLVPLITRLITNISLSKFVVYSIVMEWVQSHLRFSKLKVALNHSTGTLQKGGYYHAYHNFDNI